MRKGKEGRSHEPRMMDVMMGVAMREEYGKTERCGRRKKPGTKDEGCENARDVIMGVVLMEKKERQRDKKGESNREYNMTGGKICGCDNGYGWKGRVRKKQKDGGKESN